MASKLDALKQLPEHYVMCRWLRHKWEFDGTFKNGKRVVAVTHCPGCHTVKEQHYDGAFNITKTQYHYPRHYLVSGSGRLRAQAVRKEVITRHKPQAKGLTGILALLKSKQPST